MSSAIKQNIPSAIVLFLVALPLCLGIAQSQGAPPIAGLITGIVGGIVVGALGASPLSIAGPSAGLSMVVISGIAATGGFQAFSVAVIIAGAIQMGLAWLKFGMFSKFIPGSVIRGLLAAVGIIIVLKQIPHVFGYDGDFIGDLQFTQGDGRNTFTELWFMTGYMNATTFLISAVSLSGMLVWEKQIATRYKRLAAVPGALVAVVLGIAVNELAGHVAWLNQVGESHLLRLPGNIGPKDLFSHFYTLNFAQQLQKPEIWKTAVVISLLASTKSLIGLEASDKIDPQRRVCDKNRDLLAQGIGNVLCGLFGGLPLTTVLIGTIANAKAGATSRISVIIHGLLLLAATLLIAPFFKLIPLTTFAVIIAVVGYRLTSYTVFKEQWVAGREHFLPFLATFVAVIFTDIITGAAIGFLVALAFILKGTYQKGFYSSQQNNVYTIRLGDSISFIHRAGLSEELRKIPSGSRVNLIADSTQSVHHDIAEVINEFQAGAQNRQISIVKNNIPYIPDRKDLKSLKNVTYRKMLYGNRQWVEESLARDRLYFEKLARGQAPQILWIGCADSRVPPNEITKTQPGEIFMHRNIANLVVHTDLNMLSVLQYAVEVLQVKQVIVCGHYECGGVATAMKNADVGLVNNWLRQIKEVYSANVAELERIGDTKMRERLLVELNVREQVRNLAMTSIIQKAWKKRQLEIHGWVVDLGTGYIKELPISLNGASDLEPIFRYKV
ncbi:carbonic anhydrase [Turneriella parva]|uniref:Carbonic anhydrase 2 n=1 Tax=Turneriella parva (strain ATCC BAA-1111 / DSM 21527 / NCTC 11395 / H) TaxID=869212 RepID=I4B8H6_TURPD|nr:carbonic anhydrase [Turneriella parva]AFM13583.1 carbonic anhydrase [Turneriella parva DSM 21527]